METQKSNVKRQNYMSKLKTFKFLVVILSFEFCVLSFFSPIVYAADSTPSADIKAKLEELKKEIASKAAKLKLEISNKLQNKAYIGNVKTKSSNTLTLAAKTEPKIVNINQDTLFESQIKARKNLSLKTLNEEDYIVALGDIDETKVLTAKRVILMSEPKISPKTYLWGQIVSKNDTLITLKDKDNKNVTASLTKANLVNKEGRISLDQIRTAEYVLATGHMDQKEIFQTSFLFVSQASFLKPKNQASPSATPKESPKTSPKKN